MTTVTDQKLQCYHCGEPIASAPVMTDDKPFCCEGCRMVYQLLQKSDLCTYYDLNTTPGATQRIPFRKNKFAFLDDPAIKQKLISFSNEEQEHITFYLPQVHCSSCLWLLENLRKLDPGVISSKVHFTRKEVDIVYDPSRTSLRKAAELLTRVGYEPYLSLQDLKSTRPRVQRALIYQLGVAGFCFANIMMMSFPEYLGLESTDLLISNAFRYLNLLLSLPVLLFSAQPFYESAWGGLRHKFLNIDAPIVLAILVTWIRSAFEVTSGNGAGFFDSFSGIVFFMLIGRILQDRTYQRLSFDRDYTSYFPVAITVIKEGKEFPKALPEIRVDDTLRIHHEELIPADGILTRGKALIDYSFVTGESAPVTKEMGEIVYAGGRQTGGAIELLTIKEVSQSYLTRLWSREEMKPSGSNPKGISFVHWISRMFTYIVLLIATGAALYWYFHDAEKIWPAVTAVLIIACPCALLLSHTFTNGNILSILSANGIYLKHAQSIEDIAKVGHIVFDKTGTLTSVREQEVEWIGQPLNPTSEQCIAAIASQSQHPLSRTLSSYLQKSHRTQLEGFQEHPGRGMEATVNGMYYRVGSQQYIRGEETEKAAETRVYVSCNEKVLGYFRFVAHYRDQLPETLKKIGKEHKISILSGDTAAEKFRLREMLGADVSLLFNHKPEDKLNYIRHLQHNGDHVMMLGDGLNDAGALKQSQVGIAITEDRNNFTPASDVIMEAKRLIALPSLLRIARANKQIILASFVLSIAYNLVGLFYAVQGDLSPMIAAILMPSSSLSIILITYGLSSLAGKILFRDPRR